MFPWERYSTFWTDGRTDGRGTRAGGEGSKRGRDDLTFLFLLPPVCMTPNTIPW